MDELSSYDPFATPGDCATFWRRNLSGADAATVADNLAAASDAIREACEWQIWPQLVDDVLTLDVRGGQQLVLPVSRVAAVSSFVLSGSTLTPDTDYDWSASGIIDLPLGRAFPVKRRGAVLTLTHGYVDCPRVLNRLAMTMAGRPFAQPFGEIRQRAGQVDVQFNPTQTGVAVSIELTDADLRVIAPFRGGYR